MRVFALALNIENNMKDFKAMYEEFKAKHPGALAMFRQYDWYTADAWYIMVDEDADVASKELVIPVQPAIGMFQKQVEMSAKDLDIYLPKLVKNGHRIAILDYE